MPHTGDSQSHDRVGRVDNAAHDRLVRVHALVKSRSKNGNLELVVQEAPID